METVAVKAVGRADTRAEFVDGVAGMGVILVPRIAEVPPGWNPATVVAFCHL